MAIVLLLLAYFLIVALWLMSMPNYSDELVSDLISLMTENGYTFECGPHCKGMTGYYADFFKQSDRRECEECGCPVSRDWSQVGHANTVRDATVMAAKIATAQVVDVPRPHTFEK